MKQLSLIFSFVQSSFSQRASRKEYDDTPKHIIEAYNILHRTLKGDLSLAKLQEVVEKLYRKKKVHYLVMKLPDDMYGCVLALPDCDLIIIQEGLTEILFLISKIHELSHLILGHVALVSPDLPPLNIFKLNPYLYLYLAIPKDQTETTNKSSSQNIINDKDAEAFARLLFPGILMMEYTTSQAAKIIYNEQ